MRPGAIDTTTAQLELLAGTGSVAVASACAVLSSSEVKEGHFQHIPPCNSRRHVSAALSLEPLLHVRAEGFPQAVAVFDYRSLSYI